MVVTHKYLAKRLATTARIAHRLHVDVDGNQVGIYMNVKEYGKTIRKLLYNKPFTYHRCKLNHLILFNLSHDIALFPVK